MIKFKQLSCGSDCTGPYKVDISLPMTAREFIDEILTNYKSEWGYIGIYKKGEIFGYPRCEYSHGELLSLLPEEYLDRQIEKVSGSGGWSNSDFILHLAKDVVEASPKDQCNADIVAMLEELKDKILHAHLFDTSSSKDFQHGMDYARREDLMVIQEKIDSLKENSDVC